jgi:hypothetical protein
VGLRVGLTDGLADGFSVDGLHKFYITFTKYAAAAFEKWLTLLWVFLLEQMFFRMNSKVYNTMISTQKKK